MFFTSDTEVAALAGSFYSRMLPISKWNAATQLTITLYYSLRFPYRMAFDLLREGVQALSAGAYASDETTAKLDSAIHHWLQKAKAFEREYQNIEDLSALANIFIANHWRSEPPYEGAIDAAFLDADTARFLMPERSDSELAIA